MAVGRRFVFVPSADKRRGKFLGTGRRGPQEPRVLSGGRQSLGTPRVPLCARCACAFLRFASCAAAPATAAILRTSAMHAGGPRLCIAGVSSCHAPGALHALVLGQATILHAHAHMSFPPLSNGAVIGLRGPKNAACPKRRQSCFCFSHAPACLAAAGLRPGVGTISRVRL